jgi:hypothetical protein
LSLDVVAVGVADHDGILGGPGQRPAAGAEISEIVDFLKEPEKVSATWRTGAEGRVAGWPSGQWLLTSIWDRSLAPPLE